MAKAQQGKKGKRPQSEHKRGLRAQSRRRGEQKHAANARQNAVRQQAGVEIAAMPAGVVVHVQAAFAASGSYESVARDFGISPYAVKRVVKYGQQNPWEAHCAARAARRAHLQRH